MKKKFFDQLKQNMKKAQSILSFCTKHQAEFLPVRDGFILTIPQELSESEENEFKSIVQEDNLKIQFHVAPKNQTRRSIESLIYRARPTGGDIQPNLETRSISIKLDGVDKHSAIWGDLSEILKKDGFFKSWQFWINGEEHNVLSEVNEEVFKNQKREGKTISDDNITDLKIGLAQAQSVDDILKAMEGK